MTDNSRKVAIVGISGRFPGANSVTKLWSDVIMTGREAITVFEAPGGSRVGFGVMKDAGMFDSNFFDMSPGEARRITPQHRLFLECVWQALESAGIDITQFDGYASVYASASINPTSYLRRILDAVDKEQIAGAFDLLLGNAVDTLATRVGYKLGLRGECLTVQSHCSSSLVAVHLACQSILSGQSDLAIAGGVSVRFSMEADQETELGLLAGQQEGFILSPEGQCRALLEGATGTISGDGVGAVVLKPLDDAIADGNTIFAVISASAVNNDGRDKMGFTAPSVDGVANVIHDALAFAEVGPDEVGYIECHGTGTDLGDAIELRALRKVFGPEGERSTPPVQLGSIKSNIGHLAAGSGVVGLIKAALALYNKGIPPLTHAGDHAPHTEIVGSNILAIPTEYKAWDAPAGQVRRAGVSSLGIGGTNAHILMEEAPEPEADRPAAAPASLLVWSAKTAPALDSLTRQIHATLDFRRHLIELPDAAHTLQVGRARFSERRYLVASDFDDALAGFDGGRVVELSEELRDSPRKITFMFPGYGVERAGMGRQLLDADPGLRDHLVTCQAALKPWTDFDLLGYLEREDFDVSQMHTGDIGAAIVALEWAVAQRYLDWGVEPDAVIGSSLGEYTAACVAGALTLEDTFRIVYARGRLLHGVSGGAMTLTERPFSWLQKEGLLEDGLEEAIRVSDERVIVSGPADAIGRLEAKLEERDIYNRRMPVSIAFHSAMVEPLEAQFRKEIEGIEFQSVERPYISNLTGTWFDQPKTAVADYWYRQMRNTVLFQEGLQTLHDEGSRFFLEVGPGLGLAKFCTWNFGDDVLARSSVTHPKSTAHDWSAICEAVGTAWLCGSSIDWHAFDTRSRIVQMPTYPFQGRFYYLGEETPAEDSHAGGSAGQRAKRAKNLTLPRNYLEEQVAKIWSDILGVAEIGIDENFFDLGGDSLQATRVLGRLQADITSDISVEEIMQHRTIREIAGVLEAKLVDDDAAPSGDEEQYYCAFDLDFGGVLTTVHLTQEDYDRNGIPDGAMNIRILG